MTNRGHGGAVSPSQLVLGTIFVGVLAFAGAFLSGVLTEEQAPPAAKATAGDVTVSLEGATAGTRWPDHPVTVGAGGPGEWTDTAKAYLVRINQAAAEKLKTNPGGALEDDLLRILRKAVLCAGYDTTDPGLLAIQSGYVKRAYEAIFDTSNLSSTSPPHALKANPAWSTCRREMEHPD